MVNATDFDGSTDYFLRGGGLTGAADDSVGTLSFWANPDSFGSLNHILLAEVSAGGTFRMRFVFDTNGSIFFAAFSSGGATRLSMNSATNLSTGSWSHLIFSWDTASNTRLFINDMEDGNSPDAASSSGDIDYTVGEWPIAANGSGTGKYTGCLSELWFDPTTHFDLTMEANRRKFITADLKAVDLGADGSTPTGSAPIIYLPNAFSSFGTNAGTGGNFTDQGSVAACADAPPEGGSSAVAGDYILPFMRRRQRRT